MSENPFWVIVMELYPIFLQLLLLYGIFRMGKGVLEKMSGDNKGISKALNDVIIAFFWAHISLPLVTGIFNFMQKLSNTVEPVIKIIGD